MTVREHLSKVHQQVAANHIAMAKCFNAMAAKCEKATGDQGDLSGGFAELGGLCADAAEWHILQSKELDSENFGSNVTGKAAGGDLNKIVPDGVRGVISDVPAEGFGLTAVPRFGSRSMRPMGIDTSGIPAGFQKLVEISEE